jgi:response regulator RpfG family c-di-GMP phosphodiesterase
MANLKSFDFKGKNILIVEDDQPLRELFGNILKSAGAVVRMAENGLVAKTVFDLNPDEFDLIASDVRMPEMDGIQLLRHVKEVRPKVPFLLFTGFSEVVEAKQAFEIGANGFLAKPFRASEFKEEIEKILNPIPAGAASEADVKINDEFQFCKIHVDEFLSASKLSSDIYVRVANSKFIKVARAGTEIPIERIQTYKDKKVDFFYVLIEDFDRYIGFNLKLVDAVSRSKKIAPEKKLALYKHTAETLVQKIFISGMDPALCEEAQTLVANTLNIVGENPNLFELLSMLQARGDQLYTHSLAVSVYSCLIAKKFGWTAAQTQYKLSIAGLYHDIGLKELPIELIAKSRMHMNSEEIKLYETHTVRGRDLLLSMKELPGDLAQISFQHHESQAGTGYPLRISGLKIHPLAKMIRLADEFCERSFEENCTTTDHAKKIVQGIFDTKAQDFEPLMLRALFNVFGATIPSQLAKRSAS